MKLSTGFEVEEKVRSNTKWSKFEKKPTANRSVDGGEEEMNAGKLLEVGEVNIINCKFFSIHFPQKLTHTHTFTMAKMDSGRHVIKVNSGV